MRSGGQLNARLVANLRALHLPAVRESFEAEAVRALQESLSYEHYLLAVSDREVEARQQNRTARLLRESRLPLEKTLETFDLKRLPRKVAVQFQTLLDGTFLDRRENILAFGNPGSGKTHLLCALGHELVRRGRRVLFAPCALLVQELLIAKRDLKLARVLKRLGGYDAILVDDIGYVQQSQGGDGGALRAPGRPLRTRKRTSDQQPAVLEVGGDLQGPDDHRGGHRSARPS
ncbi:MAG: ATP-binding protein [Candidatus Eisenbacteria bacterium]|nr:ATP-binding protein [Candidatus Eisenbacteria bacterium]